MATRAGEAASFLRPEILALPAETLAAYIEAPELAEYKLALSRLVRYKPHTLSEAEERILAMQAETSQTARTVFGQLKDADLKFGDLEVEPGTHIELSHGSYAVCLENPNRDVRKAAFHQYYAQFDGHANTFAATLAGSVRQDVFAARVRNYSSARTAALFPDQVPEAVYDNLITAVRANLPAVHKYYAIRRRAMKLPDLHIYDTYVPIFSDLKKHTPWEAGVRAVLESLKPLGTSYGEGTWTRAAEDALVRLIAERGLRKPVVIGHFVVGAQLAIRLAADHPALVGGVVILGAEPMRYFASRRDSSGRTPAGREERAASVDRFQAPRWYKYVTTQTWETNNYAPSQYSSDSARAAALWARSARVPMPVMIRYLCEFIAMDFTDAFAAMTVPTEVLVPSFTPGILADPKQSYVKPLFHDAWETVRGTSPRVTISRVGDSRIFVTDDQPAAVEAAMARVAKGARENSQERQPPYDAALAKQLGADARGMKRYVLVMLKTGSRTDFAKDELHTLLTGHQANIKRLAHEGKLVVAGPFGDNTHGYEGIFILTVATQSEAEALLKTDPAIAAGRFAFEAVEWYGSAALQETVAIHQRIDKTGR